MIHLYDRPTILAFGGHQMAESLWALLAERIRALPADLIDYTEFLVVEAGDAEEDILRAVGFSPLVEPIERARYGTADFAPWWDYLADHGGWFEMIVTFGGDYACVLLIEDAAHERSGLASLARTYC